MKPATLGQFERRAYKIFAQQPEYVDVESEYLLPGAVSETGGA
jgi:hypothetical protein